MKAIKQLLPTTLTRFLTVGMFLLLGLLIGAAGCTGTRPAASPPPLRVAIAPDYPPLVFKRGGAVVGAEVDLAYALGHELGRPVKFVSCRFEDLIPALVQGRADIIMSGLSVTEARRVRIAFTEPYLRNQLRAIFRRQNADRFKTRESVLNTMSRIGVVPGTTAEAFVKKNCTNATYIEIASREYAAFYLLQGGQIDLFIDDTFALAQIISENEAELTFLEPALAEDNLAWGIRREDTEFLRHVNAILARWKSDGTLDQILNRWMPYLKKYEARLQTESAVRTAP